ncbi:MAG: class I SAM-dependent methyltransferase [Bacteroidota bacterium]
MKQLPYLEYVFEDNEKFINTFDEAPLWSAAFGLLLLKHVPLKPNSTLVDVGSGAGFPLMELAGRLGNTCKLYGVDPWANANRRAKQKISNYNYSNVELIESSAENLPFADGSVDIIVSNLGVNNVSQPAVVFKECWRVLKPDGKLALTTNLSGHWKELYEVFYTTLLNIGKEKLIPVLKKEEEHRGTVESVSALYTENGFTITQCIEEQMVMKFADGSAFLNHHFVKVGWLTTWVALFPKQELPDIFRALEQALNKVAVANTGLSLTVPMLYMEGTKC